MYEAERLINDRTPNKNPDAYQSKPQVHPIKELLLPMVEHKKRDFFVPSAENQDIFLQGRFWHTF